MVFGASRPAAQVARRGIFSSAKRKMLELNLAVPYFAQETFVYWWIRNSGETAAETISVMLAVFARIEPALRKSITFDNDTAFAQHALVRTMRAMTTWFCDAYASWQKGGVENANGRLRRWLPRQIDIDQVSESRCSLRASRALHDRYRPCCGLMAI